MRDDSDRKRTRLDRAEAAISIVEGWAASALVAALTLLVFAQVIMRYLLSRPPLWTEEFARYALVWLTFIGAGYLMSRGRHIAVEVLDHLLRGRWLASVRLFANACTVSAAVFIVYASPAFLRRVNIQRSAAGNLPMSWVYGAVVVGSLLIGFHAMIAIFRDLLVMWRGEPVELETDKFSEPIL